MLLSYTIECNANLYNNILILFVWPFIDSAPGHYRDMRPVSLEPERQTAKTLSYNNSVFT
jgi:hypothetical protein